MPSAGSVPEKRMCEVHPGADFVKSEVAEYVLHALMCILSEEAIL